MTLFAFIASVLVSEMAKYAAGSGIPEVKTILSGFIMRSFLGGKTLLIKLTCLPLVTASGMAVGKEGPLVHVACCVGNIFPRIFTKYAKNEAKKREILSAAVAAGVSSAFGAPIGGVLFSLEEVSYYFPYKTMLRSFFSAMMAAVTIQVLNPFRSGKLVMFQVTYEKSWHAFELFFFVILGVLGGLFGAVFIRLNLELVSLRKWSWLKTHPIWEASVIAFATAFICNFNVYLRMNTEKLVSLLLNDCSDHSENFEPLCNPTSYASLLGSLLLASTVKVILTVVTFGIRVPCGIFIPSICVGACVGRTLGILVELLHNSFPSSPFFAACNSDSGCIAVGPYALLGAAAFLSGVTRMTVSLVVMMFEVTGALTYILPIMITVMVAKFVGDAFGKESIYDGLIRLNGYPFLDSKEEYAKVLNTGHVMTSVGDLVVLTATGCTVASLERLLRETSYKGFPIVLTLKDMQLIGYINRNELKYALG
ncbi:glycerol ethanol, ferric requiring protein, partial [Coelomomyces lativittatus]